MSKPHAASPAIASEDWEATRPSSALRSAVRRRAAAVSEKLAARGLGAFVWRKKLDRELSRGVLPGIVSVRSERRRCLARRTEADGVRATARRVSPPPPLVSSAASLARAEEEAKEAAFLLQQSRLRAAIRFAEGRPRRVDMLVESLRGARRCALAAFRGASAEELKELTEEIGVLAGLDRENGRFWEAAKLLCDAEMVKADGAGADADGRSGRSLHSEVAADVLSLVEGKSIEELEAMQQIIAARMADGESKVVDQLQEVTELIRVEKAKKFLAQNYSTCDDDDAPAPPSVSDEEDTEQGAWTQRRGRRRGGVGAARRRGVAAVDRDAARGGRVEEAQVCGAGADGVRVEQVQPRALRPRPPAAQGRQGLHVRAPLPGPGTRRREASAVHRRGGRQRERRDLHRQVPRGVAVRGRRVQGRQQGVGALAEGGVQEHV